MYKMCPLQDSGKGYMEYSYDDDWYDESIDDT